MLKNILKGLYRCFWYGLTLIILALAITITGLRIALPGIGNYHQEVQEQISKYLGYPVEIQNITADWEGWSPQLYLDQVHILNPTTSVAILNFNAINVSIDLLTSLYRRQLVPQLVTVSGLNLRLFESLNIETPDTPNEIKIHNNWHKTQHQSIAAQLNFDKVIVKAGNSSINLRSVVAQLSASRKTDREIELSVHIDKLLTDDGEWSNTNISTHIVYLEEYDQYQYTVHAGHLDLGKVFPILQALPGFSEATAFAKNLHLEGILHNGLFKYDPTLPDAEQLYIEADFSQITGHAGKKYWGLKNLNGHLQGSLTKGKLSLREGMPELTMANLFNRALIFEQFNADFDWQYLDNKLLVGVEHLSGSAQHFDLELKGTLAFCPGKQSPYANISLKLSAGEVDQILDYLPAKIPTKFTNWLKKSLVAGEMPAANFTLRGWLEDYPFQDNQGTFKGMIKLHNATLDYHPQWPFIDSIDADLSIDGTALTVVGTAGKLFNADITEATAVIKDFSKQNTNKSVLIEGYLNGTVRDGIFFISNSPLQSNPSFGEILSTKAEGDLELNLSMVLPLPRGLIDFDGALSLHEVSLHKEDANVELTDLSGVVHFARDSISTNQLKAQYLGYPVHLDFEKKAGQPIKKTLSGIANDKFIATQISHHFPALDAADFALEQHITGSTPWQASVLSEQSTSNTNNPGKRLIITSSLDGLAVDLPAPLGKPANAVMPLELSVKLPKVDKSSTFGFKYADILNGSIDVKHKNGKEFVQMALAFGDEKHLLEAAATEAKQISATGRIKYLEASKWLKLIAASGKLKTEPITPTITWDLNVDSLGYENQNFANVGLQLNDTDHGFLLSLDAEAIKGNIHLGKIINNDEPLRLSFAKLKLSKSKVNKTGESSDLKPDAIPPLTMEVADFSYHGINLGQLNMAISKTANGIAFDKVNFKKPDLEINSHGTWHIKDNEHHSQFNASLSAKTIKTMLETFGYNMTAIKNGEANLLLDAEWQASPADFSLFKLTGTLDLEIKKGQLLEIDPSVGRLFGLLSLQALPRRLVLDFSDLFGQGLAFNKIEGRFSIDNGNAYTNNLSMKGPAIDINISGRAGLLAQDYDQLATVSPKFANNLPIPIAGAVLGPSTFFGPVGMGIGTAIFLANKIFYAIPENVNKLLSKQYTITGQWDAPDIESISAWKNKE